jgi:hypothetical protein
MDKMNDREVYERLKELAERCENPLLQGMLFAFCGGLAGGMSSVYRLHDILLDFSRSERSRIEKL